MSCANVLCFLALRGKKLTKTLKTVSLETLQVWRGSFAGDVGFVKPSCGQRGEARQSAAHCSSRWLYAEPTQRHQSLFQGLWSYHVLSQGLWSYHALSQGLWSYHALSGKSLRDCGLTMHCLRDCGPTMHSLREISQGLWSYHALSQ